MDYSCRTVFLADAAAYALLLIYLGIASLVNADGILRTYFHANTTCHAAVCSLIALYLAILLLTSEYLPFPVSLPEIQMHQPRRSGHSRSTLPVPTPFSSLHCVTPLRCLNLSIIILMPLIDFALSCVASPSTMPARPSAGSTAISIPAAKALGLRS